MINLSWSLDAIIQEIEAIQKLQQDQLVGLATMHSIYASLTRCQKHIQDTADAQKQAEVRHQFSSQTLLKRAVANTTYDEQGKKACDDDTLIDILADIRAYLYDTSDSSQSFLWLTGAPGSGKSAIMAYVARVCKDAGMLWAQFFINHNNVATTDSKSYFPTIAR